MTEILFILTVLFIAYLVCSLSAEKKTTPQATVQETKVVIEDSKRVVVEKPVVMPEAAQVITPVTEKIKKPVESIITKPVSEPVVNTPVAPVETLIETPVDLATNNNIEVIKKEIRNPKTGEIATPHGNYQFTKRWIKEALVTEGLVDKIYKSNELDGITEAKIKRALIKLAAMDDYKV